MEWVNYCMRVAVSEQVGLPLLGYASNVAPYLG